VTPAPPDVDAVTFAKAFKAGQADQYKNRQVSGSGVSFHGTIRERVADGSTRLSLVVTLGAVDADGQLTPLKTWDEFVAAERARTTLVVALTGPDLPAAPAEPVSLTFSGVYDGQVRTIMRPPQAGGGSSAPCPGEEAREAAPGNAFHCAALLSGARAMMVK
jgi:hypothetical protein